MLGQRYGLKFALQEKDGALPGALHNRGVVAWKPTAENNTGGFRKKNDVTAKIVPGKF